MTKIEWVDDLPGEVFRPPRKPYIPRAKSKDLHDHAAQLREHPMRWAKYPRDVTAAAAARTAQAIRDNTLAAYSPLDGFESCHRGGVCFIRYNPDRADPNKAAYREGYIQGLKDAMGQVHEALWNFRQVVSGIDGWEESRKRDSRALARAGRGQE